MNEKFNNNAKFEQLIKILLSCEEEIGLIVKGPFSNGSAVDELDNHVYSIVTQLHAAFTTFTPPADHNKVLWYCRMISVFDLHDFYTVVTMASKICLQISMLKVFRMSTLTHLTPAVPKICHVLEYLTFISQ